MEKTTFFDHLEQTLAEKHALLPFHIHCIRSAILGRKRTKKQFVQELEQKMQKPRRHGGTHVGRRDKSKIYYQNFVNSILSCTDDQWADITQKTEYDTNI